MNFRIDFDPSEVPETVADEIRRNLSYLFSTPAGTCAGDRSYGLSYDMVDMPMAVAENMLALEIVDKAAQYEPRVYVKSVTCTADIDGRLTAAVRVSVREEEEAYV